VEDPNGVHKGRLPDNLNALMELAGVGRKTALLLDCEFWGSFAGVATDTHVEQGTIGFGMVAQEAGCPKLTPMHIESSLREWVDHHRLPEVNKIFGSFAQVFTNELLTVRTQDQRNMVKEVMAAMGEYLHKPHHIELLWCAVVTIRTHYRAVAKKKEENTKLKALRESKKAEELEKQKEVATTLARLAADEGGHYHNYIN
jgi:hypothetical protein